MLRCLPFLLAAFSSALISGDGFDKIDARCLRLGTCHFFVDTLRSCTQRQVMSRGEEQRNLTTGGIVYSWDFALVKLIFYIDPAVLRATTAVCHFLRRVLRRQSVSLALQGRMDANTTQIGKQLDFAFVGALAELGERRVPGDRKTAQEEREIARVRDVQSTTEVFDGRLKLRAMTARLLRVYRARMLASVVLEAAPISTFVLLDKLFRDLLWSLYYSQILAGFWACLQLMASHQGMPPEEVPVTLCPREQLVVEGIPDVHFAFVGLTAAEHKRYEHINTLLAEYGTPRLLEIGVRVGDVPAYVLEHNPELTYVGVDPYFDEGGEHYRGQVDYDIAMSRIERFGSRAEIYRGVLSQMPTEGRDNFTAVFIDGDHSFMSAYKDTKLSEQLVMNGGLIMGHDFTPWYYGIMYAATLASLRHGYGFTIYLSTDTIWWYYIPHARAV